MKHLSESISTIVAKTSDTSTAIALAPRTKPLSETDIEALDATLEKTQSFSRKPRYGSVPKLDTNGEICDWEFDKIGDDFIYYPDRMNQNLKDALLRPATRNTVAYYLTRLAAHKRNTTGTQSLGVVIEDLARELEGISEWALVQAYRELWKSPSVWYSSSVEILRKIRHHDDRLQHSLSTKPEKPPEIEQREVRINLPESKKIYWRDMTDHQRKEFLKQIENHDPQVRLTVLRVFEAPEDALDGK